MNKSARTCSLASCVWVFSSSNSSCRHSKGCTSNCSGGEEFEGSFDYLPTCVCLLCLQMRSVASWLAFLHVSADLDNPCISLAENFWSSSSKGLTLCELPTVGEKKEERGEKSSFAAYSPRQVFACDFPTISLLFCLPPHPLFQVLQYRVSSLLHSGCYNLLSLLLRMWAAPLFSLKLWQAVNCSFPRGPYKCAASSLALPLQRDMHEDRR